MAGEPYDDSIYILGQPPVHMFDPSRALWLLYNIRDLSTLSNSLAKHVRSYQTPAERPIQLGIMTLSI